jgi:hypothetical protein
MSRRIITSALGFALLATQACAFDFPNIPNPFGGGDKSAPSTDPAKPNAASLECPEIIIETGSSSLRFPPGVDSANVRHQFSIGLVARECAVEGDQIGIRVGVEGAAILGPLGQPGSFSGNLRVAVRRQKDEAILGSKVFKIGATVPAGGTRGEFRIVTDPFVVPYTSQHAADDYEILVGFTQGGEDRPQKTSRRNKPRRG